MKLAKIIYELEKDKWVDLKGKELDDYADDILTLIKNAYAAIGGHPNYQNLDDIEPSQLFTVIDIDDDPEPDAVSVAKQRPAGKKSVAMGHDGTQPAKRVVINKKVSDLKKPGNYVEVSGKIKDILIAKGVPVITDKEVIKRVLADKEITFVGNDGEYSRKIGGTDHVKILLGNPKI